MFTFPSSPVMSAAYQSKHHSHTLPCMSYSPQSLGVENPLRGLSPTDSRGLLDDKDESHHESRLDVKSRSFALD